MNSVFHLRLACCLFALCISNLLIASDSIRIEKTIQSDWGAYLHLPASKEPLPLIITLGGAEGGLSFTEEEANLIAKEGFIVMRFGYFKYSKSTMNETLIEIRLEKVMDAIEWVKKNPAIDTGKIALLGISKGAELALLVASKTNTVKAVAAHVPSHVVWYGMGKWKGVNKSSWTWQGNPLHYVPYAKPKSGWFTKRIAEFYEAGLETYPEKIEPALIPVEKIAGPVFISAGGKDDIWPSGLMSSAIEKRLQQQHFSYEYKYMLYPEAGHAIFGMLPAQYDEKAMNALASGGGTPAANYDARKQNWVETMLFFKKALKK